MTNNLDAMADRAQAKILNDYLDAQCRPERDEAAIAERTGQIFKQEFPNGLNAANIVEAISEMEDSHLRALFAQPSEAVLGANLRMKVFGYWLLYCRNKAENEPWDSEADDAADVLRDLHRDDRVAA